MRWASKFCVIGVWRCASPEIEPEPVEDLSNLPPGEDAPLNKRGESADLLGIITTFSCSGAVIDAGGPDDAPGYVLTAGHCAGVDWSEHTVTRDVPASIGQAVANFFADTRGMEIALPIEHIEYQTMHLRDLAILRLGVTRRELREAGVVPFPLANSLPRLGDRITIVGHPGGGSMRRAACEMLRPTFTAEANLWFDDHTNTCPGVGPGSSGSPVFDEGGHIWGVVSSNSGTGVPCTLDSPCEMARSGLVNAKRSTTYATAAAGLGSCFDDGRFEPEQPGCPLPLASAYEPAEVPRRYARSTPEQPATWRVDLSGASLGYYRHKAGDAHELRCDDAEGYTAARAVADAPTLEGALPTTEGMWLVCLQMSADGVEFPPPNQATAMLSQIDNTPPPAFDETMVQREPDMFLKFDAAFPTVVRFRYRIEPKGTHDCSPQPDDLLNQGGWVEVVPTEEGVACVTVEDAAGNLSAPATISLSRQPR